MVGTERERARVGEGFKEPLIGWGGQVEPYVFGAHQPVVGEREVYKALVSGRHVVAIDAVRALYYHNRLGHVGLKLHDVLNDIFVFNLGFYKLVAHFYGPVADVYHLARFHSGVYHDVV